MQKSFKYIAGVILFGIFIYLSIRYFHFGEFLKETKRFFWESPYLIIGVTICYSLSFILRAEAWKLYFGNRVKFYSCLEGVLLSLFVNHITPIKLGDVVRIGVLSLREKQVSPGESLQSVVILRFIDMAMLLFFSFIGLIVFAKAFVFRYSILVIVILAIACLVGGIMLWRFLPTFVHRQIQLVKTNLSGRNALLIFLMIAVSWALEGAVIWGVTASMGSGLSIYKAIWVNSITVGGQIFQITPGGISTYESVMTAALTTFHFSVKDGYMAAIVSHSYKFVFSYLAGMLLLLHSPVSKINQIKEILARRGL
ncbi:lysylphosphatidylglycerol synthase transmembrane domain-containing protein [Neobacillus rhizophilus]|uniref:Phosphatidylglycerol lysyltransferase n=1 Tax=Neobacillus rhizophilus TaxID=2833579 RepID=A0A942YTV3_9BACI|nr:lysylphosphatidylglycerol synthase transmembrane domain-containing protein [Neobacillus rhizophilus]MBS4212277.1 flippase-like domain-containing protein [Neobacillus rhizophilus]MBU8915712.1 flippase-like domain-containing protein [Bacillus sp. FJAT-29953]